MVEKVEMVEKNGRLRRPVKIHDDFLNKCLVDLIFFLLPLYHRVPTLTLYYYQTIQTSTTMKRIISISVMFFAVLLLNSCTKGPKPVAAFSIDKNPVLAGDTVSFTNQSTDALTFSWDFGDDSVSTLESPTHVYQKAGTFPVTLNVEGEGGKNTLTQSITVSPSLTGYWTTTYTLYMSSMTGSMNLVQHDDNTLTGNYELTQGSGYLPLLSSSRISGQSVTIEISTGGYKYSIKGTVNAALDFITGSLFGDGEVICNCYAIKKVKL